MVKKQMRTGKAHCARETKPRAVSARSASAAKDKSLTVKDDNIERHEYSDFV